jgi:hypothetical protein
MIEIQKTLIRFFAVSLLVVTPLRGAETGPDETKPELWPISVEGKWGYIDASGAVKIEPQYANAASFSEGLALVSVFGTSEADEAFDRTYDGFIDKSGKFIIPAEFPSFYTKREDWDHYSYSSFSDGVAIVSDGTNSDGPHGLIDRNGKLIVPMKFSSLSDFGDGLCIAEIRGDSGRVKRGYLDYKGQYAFQPKKFLYGTEFSEGRARIVVRDKNGDQEVLVDRQGNKIVGPEEYSSIDGIVGGLCLVAKADKVGLIDGKGQVAVPLGEYEHISVPHPGSTYIGEKKGVFYAIGPGGKSSKLPDFGTEPLGYQGDLIWIQPNGKNGYVKPDGTVVVEPIFEDLSPFEGELAKFHNGAEQGYVNRSGKIVWSTQKWELPLKYSLRDPLQSLLPDFGLEAMPLSYNWDCENAIVFVCDGNLEKLRKFYLDKRSADVEVKDHTNYVLEPGKLDFNISIDGAFIEVFAMHGDAESKSAENTDFFVSFYHCESMSELRKKYPNKTIGIMLEN